MIRKLFEKLTDPRGPLGEVLSPSDVFKERAGLPVSQPIVQRDVNFTPTTIALAAPRFVAAVDAIGVPAERVRLVSRYVEEHYAPVYDTPKFSGMAEAIRASKVLVGWTVTQKARAPHCDCLSATLEMEAGKLIHRKCGRARAHIDDADFVEHVMSLSIAPSDDFYNTDYPTIPGNDPMLVDGKVLRGEPVYRNGKMVHDGIIRKGTTIRHGRREWREKTKGWCVWDKGVVKERAKAYAAEQKKWIDGVRPLVFKSSKTRMPQKLGEL